MKTYSELECHRQTHISGHGQGDSQQKNKSPKAYTPKQLRWIPSMMVWKRWLLLNKDMFGMLNSMGCNYPVMLRTLGVLKSSSFSNGKYIISDDPNRSSSSIMGRVAIPDYLSRMDTLCQIKSGKKLLTEKPWKIKTWNLKDPKRRGKPIWTKPSFSGSTSIFGCVLRILLEPKQEKMKSFVNSIHHCFPRVISLVTRSAPSLVMWRNMNG